MADFWIDYYGYCKAEAIDREQSISNFWSWYGQDKPDIGIGKHAVSIDYVAKHEQETMPEFFIDFSGYCKVEAKNKRQAVKKLKSWYNSLDPCFEVEGCTLDIQYVDTINGHAFYAKMYGIQIESEEG